MYTKWIEVLSHELYLKKQMQILTNTSSCSLIRCKNQSKRSTVSFIKIESRQSWITMMLPATKWNCVAKAGYSKPYLKLHAAPSGA